MRHTDRARHLKRLCALPLALVLAVSLAACGGTSANQTGSTTTGTATSKSEVVLSSTTSTQDSGLFDVLIPAFEKANPAYSVKVIAVGTGEALKLGENKDADVVLAHSKPDELAFVANGFGVGRYDVMFNDFVIVGPASDPAKIKGSADTTAAMQAIAKAGVAGKATFVSRSDDSGTNKKEIKLWKAASVEPTAAANKSWYLQTGQGMGETLKVASEKGAYTISDRATYLTMQDTLDLKILLEKDKGLLNQYGVLPVTGAKNIAGGEAFATWITSPEGQKVIGDYGFEKFKQQLFTPNATGTAQF